MSQARDRQLSDSLPPVAGFIQPKHSAIDSAEIELVPDAESRRRKAVELAAGQIGTVRPGASRWVVDINRLDNLAILDQAPHDIDFHLDRGHGQRSTPERRSRQVFPTRFRASEIEDQGRIE